MWHVCGRNAYRALMGQPERKKVLKDVDIDGAMLLRGALQRL
jgi:hypothetical protein